MCTGSDTLPRKQAFEWYRRFKEGKESVEDYGRSGHPQTSRTAEKGEKVSAVVPGDRNSRVAMASSSRSLSLGAIGNSPQRVNCVEAHKGDQQYLEEKNEISKLSQRSCEILGDSLVARQHRNPNIYTKLVDGAQRPLSSREGYASNPLLKLPRMEFNEDGFGFTCPQTKKQPAIVEIATAISGIVGTGRTATAGSDVVQSGRPIFDDFFQHLWPYIGNNTANVVFRMVKRLWLIRIDQ
ncbi:hypothetical protein TNCV_1512621 [Trichonephila clavipes]|nr:hypothetical protein TNCV_1512621 [Trichonephila clavipes]